MKIEQTGFEGLLVITPSVYADERGYFFESYNKETHARAGLNFDWVQDNQSHSTYGVIRGLHFQNSPHAQTKLIRALQGSILDVVVDLRKSSSTFGKSFSLELSAENKLQLMVPKGFAHGFVILSSTADVMYKCDALYNKASESGIIFNDPDLAIDWKIPAGEQVVSEKDRILPRFNEMNFNF